MKENYGKEAVAVLKSLLIECKQKKGAILVVGCSSSEVMGGRIKKFSNMVTGEVIAKAFMK